MSIPFDPKELEITGHARNVPIFSFPTTPREAYKSAMNGAHVWQPYGAETGFFCPSVIPDNIARAFVFEGKPWGQPYTKAPDMFGINWVFVPKVGGSMEDPDYPHPLADVNDWKEKIHFPDIDQWDWAGEAEKVKLDGRFPYQISLVNGFWFERLISFMDFAPAAMALVDEDQEDAILELFQASTDFACKVIDKLCENYPMLDGFNIHDDWGSQKAPFFSDEIAYKFFVPFMKQLTGHIHKWGRYATLHSCGHGEDRVQCFIDGGFDEWDPQVMNDIHALYDHYGDKIVFGVWPDKFDPETASEEEQREAARAFVRQFNQPGKPAILGHYGAWANTPVFLEEVYVASRKLYAE